MSRVQVARADILCVGGETYFEGGRYVEPCWQLRLGPDIFLETQSYFKPIKAQLLS